MDIDLSTITNSNNISSENKPISYFDPVDDEPEEVIKVPKIKESKVKPIARIVKQTPKPETVSDLQDDENQKIELVTILRLYLIKFKDDLKDYQKLKLDKLPIERLKELRNTFDIILGANTSINNKLKMFYSALYFVEKTVTNFNLLDVEGLTQVLYSNKDFQRDLQRLSLKYLSATDSRPEVSVPLTIVQTMFELDRLNSEKRNNNISNEDNEIKINNINNNYNDL